MGIKALYAAFDLYPSAKGSATHMTHMIDVLHAHFAEVAVFSLGQEGQEDVTAPGLIHHTFRESIPNYLERAQAYTRWLEDRLSGLAGIEMAHFRDIWSALALVNHPMIDHTLFEVNGLPSIELPFRYRYLSDRTIRKIRDLEAHCLVSSDHICCPSRVIRDRVIDYGVRPDDITVVSNGAEKIDPLPVPDEAPGRYILYFGALQPWQGLDVLIKAFYQLQDFEDLHLVICSSQKSRFSKTYRKMAEKLGVERRIRWYYQLDKPALYALIQHAKLSVAPLKENSRNIVQGCSPLKIFESLANRTTVVASDIPAVREIITHHETGKLVRPDRPAELARAIRFLLDYPDINREIAENGYRWVMEYFTWDRIKTQMKDLYELVTI